MDEEKIFVSKIDPKYSIKCWKGPHVAYAFHIRSSNTDMFDDPVYDALPAMEVPADVVNELKLDAYEYLELPPLAIPDNLDSLDEC